MSIEVWPFLVSRNKFFDYRTIVSPGFISANIIAKAAGGETTPEGVVLYREIHNSNFGEIALIYRVKKAIAKDIQLETNDVLKDNYGREIAFIEGFVVRKFINTINVELKDFDEIHRQLIEPYTIFWESDSPSAISDSKAYFLQNKSDAVEYLKVKKLQPLVLKATFSSSTNKSLVKLVKSIPTLYEANSVNFHPRRVDLIAVKCHSIVQIWNISNPSNPVVIFEYKARELFENNIWCPILFSPNGQFLATGIIYEPAYQNVVILLDWENKKTIKIKGHTLGSNSKLLSVAFSPDSELIASSSYDGQIKLWDVLTQGELLTLNQDYPVRSIAFSPDGKLLASANDCGLIIFWSPKTGKPINKIQERDSIKSIVFSPDGKLFASANKNGLIKIFTLKNPDKTINIQPHKSQLPVNSIKFSIDGEIIASASDDGTICFSSIQTGNKLKVDIPLKHSFNVNSIDISSDGKTLASASDDQSVKIWQLK